MESDWWEQWWRRTPEGHALNRYRNNFDRAVGPPIVEEKPVEETPIPQTATEILMTCLEDFGEDEPENVIVVWNTKSGDMAWLSNIRFTSAKVGLLELAKSHVLNDSLKTKEQE